MLNRIKAMWARLWRRRDHQTSEHEFYDQHEASRYRSEAEAGDRGIRPVETRCSGGGVPSVWNKIKAAFGRLWRPRRRRTDEHGFYDQRASSQHRSQQVIEQSGGRTTRMGDLASGSWSVRGLSGVDGATRGAG